jgi:general secretion pathway protein D
VEPLREETGILMVVTPQINDDGNITMIVEPSVTRTVPSRITAPPGLGTLRDPRTRSTRALLRVRSGDTLVVGGLIDNNDEEIVTKVPVLSGIPFLGEAFKNKESSGGSTELIVFVTPQIVPEAGETKVAAAGASAPMTEREQERGAGRGEQIEQTLNQLERPAL